MSKRLAEPLDGPTVAQLRAWSREHAVTIACGIAERSGNRCHNTAVIVSEGELVMVYRKTQLWLADFDKFAPGAEFRAVPWRGTTLGALICFDIEFPETAAAWPCSAPGCSPSAMATWCRIGTCIARWRRRVRWRTRCSSRWPIGGCRAQRHVRRRSLIADPEGNILAEADG